MNEKYQIIVEDSLSGEKVEVEIEEKEIYDACRRSFWNIEKNNQKHSVMETPFSSLTGGEEGSYENFHEFIDEDSTPEKILIEKEKNKDLYQAISQLSDTEKKILIKFHFKHITYSAIGEELFITKQAVHLRMNKIYAKLREILKNY